MSATCSALEKALHVIDSSSSILSAHLDKNKAASCVFTLVSDGTESLSLEAMAWGQDKNHFQVSGHRTMQDDLFKEESFKGN